LMRAGFVKLAIERGYLMRPAVSKRR